MKNDTAHIVNREGSSNIILVCEHASSHIPREYAELGLKEENRLSHVVWDIGAFDVASTMSELLDAPLVASKRSRLLYDCNRSPDAKDAIPRQSELITIPGNVSLSAEEQQRRVREIHDAFHTLLDRTLTNQASRCNDSLILVTIHSFTPVYFNQRRELDIGLLHDEDPTIALGLVPIIQEKAQLRIRLNEPYSEKDGVTYTLKKHATRRNIQNVMIEVNNELIRDAASAQEIGVLLSTSLNQLISTLPNPKEPHA